MNVFDFFNIVSAMLIGFSKAIIDTRLFNPTALPDTPWWRTGGKRYALFFINDSFHVFWNVLLLSSGLCAVFAHDGELSSIWYLIDAPIAGLTFILFFHVIFGAKVYDP